MTTMATRNLSPSGSHYVYNLQATIAGDGGDGLRGSFPHSRSFNPVIDSERIVERALKVCLSFASFRVEVNISFLIFQIYTAPSTLLWADGGWRRAAVSGMCVVGCSVGIPFKEVR